MNKLPLRDVKVGSYLSKEGYLDDKFILLSPEIPVTEALINRLREWKFDTILTEGELTAQAPAGLTVAVAAAGADAAPLAAADQGRRDNKQLEEAKAFYRDLVQFGEKLFSGFLSNNELPMAAVQERVKAIMERVRDEKRYILRLNELNLINVNYVVDHAIKTTILSIAVGSGMRMPPHRLMDLGTASILHEIGMIRLPSQLYMSDRQLTPKERKAITTHTVLGFKILRQFAYPMAVCLAVLECRENLDGTGYPRGLQGEKISQYGKVINPCSTFAAMIAARPYRPPIDGHTIMLTLLKGRGSKYDEEVLRSMLSTLSLFPYGTYVQLSGGARAVVADVNPNKPRTPLVRLLTDAVGNVIKDGPIVDSESDKNQITGVLSLEEVRRLKQSIE